MHILYIHQYFTTPEEGGGTRSYEFARSLAKRGHKVTMLTGSKLNNSMVNKKKKNDEHIEGIHIIYLKTLYSNYMPFKKRLYSFVDFSLRSILAGIKIKRYDLIFATSTPLTVAIPGIILSFLRRVPMVFEVRDLWPEVPIQMGVIKNSLLIKLLRWFEAFTYRHSNHIIALSPGMAKGILATGVAINKVTMIPNFCNLDFFKPEKSNINNLGKLEYNNNPIIAYCGAISYANNLELIIHVAEKLQKMNNPVIFVIAGEGRLKPKLEKLTKVKKLKNVIFLGKINKYEVVELYRKAIACLILFKNLPILSTNSPNKFFDALAAGRPIITNMGGWIGNLVENYKIGFSLENDNPHAIIEAVEKLTNMNKNQLEEIGKNARKLAAEKFNREDMVEKLEMVFKKATKSS
jgi:glycosyltransferase involved in cell wall biosynthesis